MSKHITSSVRLLSFDQVYNESIRPKLEALDIFLKEGSAPFQLYEVARILEIDMNELSNLMQKLDIEEIDTLQFFNLLLSGSSELCQLIQRQFKHTQANQYTPEIIADIYKLSLHKVKSAFNELGAELITDVELVEVFKRIHLMNFV